MSTAKTKQRGITEDDLKADFQLFLIYLWRQLLLPDPTPLQMELAAYLQNGPKRMMIQAFRGIGKSWIAAAFCVWLLWNNPQLKILVVSASAGKAKDFSLFCQRVIEETPILRHLKPDKGQKTHRWSVMKFDVSQARVSQSASLMAKGVTGQITGDRADRIIFDDVEVPDNSLTIEARDKIFKKCTVDGESILIPENDPGICYLGTPQTEESLYVRLLDMMYSFRIWPARVPTQEQAEKYNGHLAPSIEDMLWDETIEAGAPTDPQRFDHEELHKRELGMGRSGFLLQYMLDTSLSDAERYPLKLADLIILESALEDRGPTKIAWGSSRQQVIQDLPSYVGFSGDRWHRPMMLDSDGWAPWDGCIMAIDPSGRGKDELAFAVVSILHGRLFVLASGGLPGGYEMTNLELLSKIARKHKVSDVLIESNFGDGMFCRLLQPVLERHHKCAIEEVRHNVQKERRIIDTLEPLLNGHKLILSVDVIQNDLKLCSDEISRAFSLFYQMTHITKDRGCLRHDDRLDALAIACNYWVEHMSRDSETAQREWTNDLWEKELEKHVQNAVGDNQWNRDKYPTAETYDLQSSGWTGGGGGDSGRNGILGNVLGNF